MTASTASMLPAVQDRDLPRFVYEQLSLAWVVGEMRRQATLDEKKARALQALHAPGPRIRAGMLKLAAVLLCAGLVEKLFAGSALKVPWPSWNDLLTLWVTGSFAYILAFVLWEDPDDKAMFYLYNLGARTPGVFGATVQEGELLKISYEFSSGGIKHLSHICVRPGDLSGGEHPAPPGTRLHRVLYHPEFPQLNTIWLKKGDELYGLGERDYPEEDKP